MTLLATASEVLKTSSAASQPLQHILIVDRDAVAALVTERGLQAALGAAAEVSVAPSAGAAWLRCRRETFDLVIIDPSPPDRAAGALVKALRAERPDIAVLVLTAMDTPGLRAQMRALGVQHYFAKPLMLRELERGVRLALGINQAAREDT
jgi:DNA-binding response OmpR family regulator